MHKYNKRINFLKAIGTVNWKINIEEEELKKMTLETIKKRIDESIKFVYEELEPEKGCTNEMAEILSEVHKALAIYKDFIMQMEEIRNPVYDWQIIVKKLEEKYYPQPKLKTVKDKLSDFIDEHCTHFNGAKIINALIKFRDELSD